MDNFNYKRLWEDFAYITYGCNCCKDSGNCNKECTFVMDETKVIDCINNDVFIDEEDKLKIEDYLMEV